MKTIVIGFLAMLLSNCVIPQKSATNKTIAFTAPKKSERRTNVKDLDGGYFRSHGILKHTNLSRGLLYDVGKGKLFVTAANGDNKKDFLMVMREDMLSDNNHGFMKWTFDEIKELNNFIYLKGNCRYRNDPFNYVTILAVDKLYTRQMVAYIEYDEKDQEEGDKMVQDFLKSVKFK